MLLRRSFAEKRFLITGASGQIGQQLVPYMYKRYGESSVFVSDLKPVTYNVKTQPSFNRIDVSVISI